MMKVFKDRKQLILFQKGVSFSCLLLSDAIDLACTQQIKCWMTYQYMKDQVLDPHKTGAVDPYASLLCLLTSGSAGKPCQKTAMYLVKNPYRKC